MVGESLFFFFPLVDERKRGEHGLTKNLRPAARQVPGAPGLLPSGGWRGAAGRAGPGARGGLGAARSAGPCPPLALRRAALTRADWALRRRGGEAEAGAGVRRGGRRRRWGRRVWGPGGDGAGGGGWGGKAEMRGVGGRAAGLRPRLSGGGRELCGGRGSSKWRHVDPRRNRAVVVPEDISHPVPAHWLRGATFTHTPAPASAPSRRRHSKGQPRRPARPQSLLQPGRRRHAGAALATARSVYLVSRKH